MRLTFLECVDTLIQHSAQLELLKLMWRLRENLVLAYPVDICFIPLIINAILLIPPPPLLSSTAESRFTKYLRDAHIDSGESLHSFRSGCALTLAFSGSPLADVMSHVGWSTSRTALCYLKLADVARVGAPADLLASALSQCQEALRVYEDYNALKDFLSAFPAPTFSSPKRSLPP